VKNPPAPPDVEMRASSLIAIRRVEVEGKRALEKLISRKFPFRSAGIAEDARRLMGVCSSEELPIFQAVLCGTNAQHKYNVTADTAAMDRCPRMPARVPVMKSQCCELNIRQTQQPPL
jgi:hypothetical protein